MRNIADVTGGKSIAVWSQSISGVSAVNLLVAFYDINGRKRGAILLFCPGHQTRHETNIEFNQKGVAAGVLNQNKLTSLHNKVSDSQILRQINLKRPVS
jgi:hypothetical protein